MSVYVRWYGKVLEGELLDGEWQGMKRVRIPLDGCRPVALFTAGNVFSTPAESLGDKSPKYEVCTIEEPLPVTKKAKPVSIKQIVEAEHHKDMLEQFKAAHWDHEHNHLRTDALDEFYQLWCGFHRYAVGVDPALPGGDRSSTVTLPSHAEKPAPVAVETPAPKSEPQPVKSKEVERMRCWRCAYLDYDCISDCQEQPQPGEHFCGLHGRTRVDPDGEQMDLDHHGGCGFSPRKQAVQLSLFV